MCPRKLPGCLLPRLHSDRGAGGLRRPARRAARSQPVRHERQVCRRGERAGGAHLYRDPTQKNRARLIAGDMPSNDQTTRSIMRLNRRTALAALTAMAIGPVQAHATDWPTKPVTIYVTTA